jgi:hypothetical protein
MNFLEQIGIQIQKNVSSEVMAGEVCETEALQRNYLLSQYIR